MATEDVIVQAQVGPQGPLAVGSNLAKLRAGVSGELLTGLAHAPYYEAVKRGNVYLACNQTAVSIGTALTATGVTFHLWNPPGSGWDLVILRTSLTVPAITTAGNVVYAANTVTGTAVSAGTALTVGNALLNGASGVGLAKSATTLPATPVAIRPLATVHTAAGILTLIDDVDGAIVVSPGAVLSVQGVTVACTALVGMIWEEVKIPS